MYQKHSSDVEIETKKANVKHKVASKSFLKLSLLYVKKVGPTTFTIENLAPVAKSLDTPALGEAAISYVLSCKPACLSTP